MVRGPASLAPPFALARRRRFPPNYAYAMNGSTAEPQGMASPPCQGGVGGGLREEAHGPGTRASSRGFGSRYETNVVHRLVQLLVPAYPALDGAVRAGIEDDVTAFVAGQIRSMPSFLRIPYRLAVVAFDWLAVLRHGRPFVALHSEPATAYLSLWSSSRLGPTRDFVKLIRSCALFAYFDHPQVRGALDMAPPAEPAAQQPPPGPLLGKEGVHAVGHGLD
jgi:hypothetical protein